MTDETYKHVLELDAQYVFAPWSAQTGLERPGIAEAHGSTLVDYEGREYLDFSSQLVFTNAGHQHPRLVAALKAQADRLCTIAPAVANDVRARAAERLVEIAGGHFSRVLFTTGGTEANENALRLARNYTGRQKVLAAFRSFHGASAGAISATGEPRRWGSEPAVPGVVHFLGPYLYRSSFFATTPEEECARALAHLDEVLSFEGPHTVAAIILETVVGTNGVLVPPDGYLAGVRERCDRHGIVLIADEVMVGFGRCGEWFAIDHWDVEPDLISFAKGVNSGYVPLGGVLVSAPIAHAFAQRPYPGGLTYSGHPLACAVALENLTVYEEEGLITRARDLGESIIRPALEEIAARHAAVGEVRGLGCFFAIELVKDKATREMFVPFNPSPPDAAPMRAVIAAIQAGGVWPFTHFNRIHLAPPLVITEEELRRGLEIIDAALDVADDQLTG